MRKMRATRIITPKKDYVAVCKNINEFCRETIWNHDELIPPIRLDGKHLSRCPSCWKPITWMRAENAMPFDEEDIDDAEIQEEIQLSLFGQEVEP